MKDLQDNDYTIIFNTVSDAEYIEIMQLELDNVSHGYYSDDAHADLYDLFDWVSMLVDEDHPRFAVETNSIDAATKMLKQKTSVSFDVVRGMEFA